MIGTIFTCPACGAALVQAHPEHRLLGCVCGTVSYLQDNALQVTDSRKDPQSPEPWFIKIGTVGQDASGSFEVTGRVLLRNEDTIFNYWTLLFEDGTTGLLSEGYGVYSVLRKIAMPPDLYPAWMSVTEPGAWINPDYDVVKYRLMRRVVFPSIQLEGSCLWGEPGASVTLMEVFQPETETAYEFLDVLGFDDWYFERRSYHVSELHLQQTLPEPLAPLVQCASCDRDLILHSWPYTRSVVCPNCRHLNLRDLVTGSLSKKQPLEGSRSFHLQLQDAVTLDETVFRVTGMARKVEMLLAENIWDEYTLYHPQAGFAYLSVYNDHWTYVKEWPDPPPIEGDPSGGFEYEDRWFEPFNKYHYKVISGAGEHLYNLHLTWPYDCKEYIYPPNTLISETTKTEQVWFYGQSLTTAEINKATGGAKNLREGSGRSYLFRNPVPLNTRRFVLTALVLAVLMVLVHTAITGRQVNRTLGRMELQFDASGNGLQNSVPLELNYPTNLVFEIEAPINNSWIYLEGTLVNSRSGAEVAFSKTLEYYHGTEDGESWSEGSREAEPVLNNLDSGRYFLTIQGQADPGIGAFLTAPTTIRIRQDVPSHWNLIHVLLLFGSVCVVLYLVHRHYEKIRYEGSPYDPYTRE
ncbi:MAG: DUF4178 domain-containing protein [Sphingobacteriales bacterium]|nr:MAG: DUF4178 domain-containing protein [Sphingobacteriales bacterium]